MATIDKKLSTVFIEETFAVNHDTTSAVIEFINKHTPVDLKYNLVRYTIVKPGELNFMYVKYNGLEYDYVYVLEHLIPGYHNDVILLIYFFDIEVSTQLTRQLLERDTMKLEQLMLANCDTIRELEVRRLMITGECTLIKSLTYKLEIEELWIHTAELVPALNFIEPNSVRILRLYDTAKIDIAQLLPNLQTLCVDNSESVNKLVNPDNNIIELCLSEWKTSDRLEWRHLLPKMRILEVPTLVCLTSIDGVGHTGMKKSQIQTLSTVSHLRIATPTVQDILKATELREEFPRLKVIEFGLGRLSDKRHDSVYHGYTTHHGISTDEGIYVPYTGVGTTITTFPDLVDEDVTETISSVTDTIVSVTSICGGKSATPIHYPK